MLRSLLGSLQSERKAGWYNVSHSYVALLVGED